MNIVKNILEGLAGRDGDIALVCNGEPVDYSSFIQQVAKRQRTLTCAGVRRGNTVLVPCGRGADYWVDVVALWGMAAVPVPIEEKPGSDHIQGILEAACPAYIIDPSEQQKGLFSSLPVVSTVGEHSAFETLNLVVESVTPDEEAVVIFTSGSTGAPKGVSLSHSALLNNAKSVLECLTIDTQDRVFTCIPFRFASSICHFLAVTLSGGLFMGTEQTLFMGDYIAEIKRLGATAVGGSPVQMRWLADYAKEEKLPLAWVMSSGDHLSDEVVETLRTEMPSTRLYNVYGLTEVGGRFCMLNPNDEQADPRSVGRPLSCLSISIVDETGAEVGVNQEGEIWASGSSLMTAYRNNKEATEKRIGSLGFCTGDLGFIDELGNVHVTGRADDVVKCGGRKVSLYLIAEKLMETGLFSDVAVCPCDHALKGTVPAALYVMQDGQQFVRKEVLKELRKTLPPNHIPTAFACVTDIPRTGSGKLDRKKLRRLVRELKLS